MATRPLSPHLTVWKWGPGMLTSILHRASGDGLMLIGLPVLLCAWDPETGEEGDVEFREGREAEGSADSQRLFDAWEGTFETLFARWEPLFERTKNDV